MIPLQAYIAVVVMGMAGFTYWQWAELVDDRDKYRDSTSELTTQVETLQSDLMQRRIDMVALRQLDMKKRKELNNAMEDNARLAAAVDAGTTRLRIKASCPVSPDLPAPSSSSGADDGAWVELARDARSDYKTLLDQLSQDQIKIAGLQEYITTICLKDRTRSP